MEVLTKIELRLRIEEIIDKIRKGAIFIHPTDTIYGLGCNALNNKSVDKIRKLKEQNNQPLSVWIPSLEWIKQNCTVNQEAEEWIKKLPGPYTLIIKLKNNKAVAENVTLNKSTVGVRYPNHWFEEIVNKCGVPIITTSANKTGQQFMTCIEDLDPDVEKGVEFMIYEGEKSGRPSKIINLTTGGIKER